MQAAKHGHSVESIVPDHNIDFYLPRKESFIKENPIKQIIKALDEKVNKRDQSSFDHY